MLTTTRSLLPNSLRTLAGAALLCLAGTAAAMPVSEYSLILFGDLQARHTHIHDRALIGGNVSGGATFATEVSDRSTSDVTVRIGGDLKGSGYGVQSGYMEIGGSDSNTGTMQCNGNIFTSTGASCVRQNPAVKNLVADLEHQLQRDTLNIASLTANGDVTGSGDHRQLHYIGSESVAVFELQGNALLDQNNNWSIHSNADTVIINVSGKNIANKGGVNIHTNGSNVVWNFYEAENIDFGHLRLEGFVLAPHADVTAHTYLGGLAAVSYEGHGHIGGQRFNGIDLPSSPTAPAVAVSEPPLWTMLLLGAGLLAMGLRRRLRTA